eukprot:14218793-Ditylum_brightwellii.AAC.1
MNSSTKIQKSKPAETGLLARNESIAIQFAEYMVHWAGLSMEMKQEVVHSCARMPYFTSKGTSSNSTVCMLPTLAPPKKHLWIYQNGLSGLLNI